MGLTQCHMVELLLSRPDFRMLVYSLPLCRQDLTMQLRHTWKWSLSRLSLPNTGTGGCTATPGYTSVIFFEEKETKQLFILN